MAIPDYQSLMLPVLQMADGRELRVPDAAERIANDLDLTEQERDELLPSGRQRLLHNRVHWAKTYLSKAGLITSPARGRFTITDEGKRLLATNPDRIDVASLLTNPSFAEFYRRNGAVVSPATIPLASDDSTAAGSTTPEEQIDAAFASLQAALRDDLIQRVLQNTPAFFEGVIVDLLLAMGYGGSRRDAATQLGRTGDGGVDGVISEDRLGLDRVYIQAKRYAPANAVGRPEVQAFVGSLVGLGATKGVFVTTSTFSSHAADFVRHLAQRIVLIDGRQLAELMIEHGVGVRTTRTLEVQRIDEDFFTEDE